MPDESLVGILMGSESDLEAMKQAAQVLEAFGVPHETRICSAHRMPEETFEYARSARHRGLQVLIAGAGMAAHLPGVLAAATTLPVIGVPLSNSPLRGTDALYAIVQMPSGIPVATVAIDGAKNAAYLALEILAIHDPSLAQHLDDWREGERRRLRERNRELGLTP
jgi:phosphoribosylaminoimidazole carboxylase PurE protein